LSQQQQLPQFQKMKKIRKKIEKKIQQTKTAIELEEERQEAEKKSAETFRKNQEKKIEDAKKRAFIPKFFTGKLTEEEKTAVKEGLLHLKGSNIKESTKLAKDKQTEENLGALEEQRRSAQKVYQYIEPDRSGVLEVEDGDTSEVKQLDLKSHLNKLTVRKVKSHRNFEC